MALNLQIVLLGIGAIIVLGVYLCSKLQNHRMPPRRDAEHSVPQQWKPQEDAPPSRRDSVVDSATDTVFHKDVEPVAPNCSMPPQRPDDIIIAPPHESPQSIQDSRAPAFNRPSSSSSVRKSASQATGFRSRKVDGFDRLGQIDYWVKIIGQRDVGRETVLAIYREGAAHFSKTNYLYGRKVTETEWCNVQGETEDSRFADLVLSIQLADRNGALSEQEMSRFSALVEKLSEGTGREFLFMTPIENAFAQAAALAEFIKHFDSIYTLNIRPQGGQQFTGPTLERCAQQVGLEKDGNHYSRFKAVADNKVILYSLADMSETGSFNFADPHSFYTRGLTFFMKPAVNRAPGMVFTEMVDTAKNFASRINGVVDCPGYNDLSERGVDTIRASIEQVAAQMAQFGIAAGSDAAIRIF